MIKSIAGAVRLWTGVCQTTQSDQVGFQFADSHRQTMLQSDVKSAGVEESGARPRLRDENGAR
jgi:hypothetical protein